MARISALAARPTEILTGHRSRAPDAGYRIGGPWRSSRLKDHPTAGT